jgi:WD40 repeat protein
VPEARPAEVAPASPVSSGPALETSRPPAPVAPATADPFARLLQVFPVSDESPAFEYPNGAIRAVAYSPAIRDLAIVTKDASLAVWSRNPTGVRARFLVRQARVKNAAYSPDGKMVAVCFDRSRDDLQTVKLWDLGDHLEAGGAEKPRFGWIVSDPFALAFSPDGKMLAAAGADGGIRLLDLSTGRQQAEYRLHSGLVRSLTFTRDGRTLIFACYDKTIRFCDVRSGRNAREPISSLRSVPNCLAIAPNGRMLAFPATPPDIEPQIRPEDSLYPVDETARWIMLPSGQGAGRPGLLLDSSLYAIRALAFSPNGWILASAGGEHEGQGEAKLRDVASGELLADLKGHRRTVECLSFSPDGKTLVTAGGWMNGPGEVKLWDLGPLATGWRPPKPDR